MREKLVSIDIGSTYTKGALFILTEEGFRLAKRVITPTTQEDLSLGFGKIYTELTGLPYEGLSAREKEQGPSGLDVIAKGAREARGMKSSRAAKEPVAQGSNSRTKPTVRFSSSAKGGLRIAAVGLVPDLTLQIARLAAWSAGGKIVADSSYRLRDEQRTAILQTSPDIILFTGGTDGGNEEMVLWNARQLADSPFQGTILYAGNNAIRREVLRILSGKRVVVAPNVMPRVGEIHIEETRQAIQRIFLDTIVEGKGLKQVREFCGTDPVPTPVAVFDLVEAIGTHREGWDRFCVIDLGGATTDVYSVGEAFWGEEGVVLKGIREPWVKRTVEGDLGIRVSAAALWDTVRPYFSSFVRFLRIGAKEGYTGEGEEHRYIEKPSALMNKPSLGCNGGPAGVAEIPTEEEIHQYVEKVASDTSYVPDTVRERSIDRFLVLAAVALATLRHAGVLEETYTPAGRIFLQSGKDLRPVKAIIGSGGYLSLFDLGEPIRSLLGQLAKGGLTAREEKEGRRPGDKGSGGSPWIRLVPENPAYYRDASYIFPLLGNYAKEYPEEVSRMAIATLIPESNRILRQEAG